MPQQITTKLNNLWAKIRLSRPYESQFIADCSIFFSRHHDASLVFSNQIHHIFQQFDTVDYQYESLKQLMHDMPESFWNGCIRDARQSSIQKLALISAAFLTYSINSFAHQYFFEEGSADPLLFLYFLIASIKMMFYFLNREEHNISQFYQNLKYMVQADKNNIPYFKQQKESWAIEAFARGIPNRPRLNIDSLNHISLFMHNSKSIQTKLDQIQPVGLAPKNTYLN